MKIILSRKGFDSSAGGYPSLILKDGTLLSLPIPDEDSTVHYHHLKKENTSYYDLMHLIKGKIKNGNKWSKLHKHTSCHLDPDIDFNVMERKEGWRGIFGQSGGAQRHLENQQVEIGDLFLFFGWFRKTIQDGKRISFDPKDRNGKHILYGYLQVGDILKVHPSTKVPDWMMEHPHCTPLKRRRKGNTIYLARRHLTWNESFPGYGTFKFEEKLVLTKDDMNKSCWDLPECFRHVPISYHKPENWKDDHFQSVARGQEFVVHTTEEVIQWAKQIISP